MGRKGQDIESALERVSKGPGGEVCAGMTDRDALVLMLAVQCTPEVVGISIDPPMTGAMVRDVIARYPEYYERLKKSADDVFRNVLEDTAMIALGRLRSALGAIPVDSAQSARQVMAIMLELRKVAKEIPKYDDFSRNKKDEAKLVELEKLISGGKDIE